MTAILIENGEIFSPRSLGTGTVLISGGKIVGISEKAAGAATAFTRGLAPFSAQVEVADAKGCYVCPGLIDPHQHLIGGSGEEGGGRRRGKA